jgi:hypothetical protein
MPKAYMVFFYHSISDPQKLAAYGKLAISAKPAAPRACPQIGDSQISKSVIRREPSFGRLFDEALRTARRPVCAD